jgi:hypothetical protein
MTLDSGPNGCSLSMKFRTLDEGQAVHAALVRFFTANKELGANESNQEQA